MVGPPRSCFIPVLKDPHFQSASDSSSPWPMTCREWVSSPLALLALSAPARAAFCYLNAPSVHPSQTFLLFLEGSLAYLFPLTPLLSKFPPFFQISSQTSFPRGRLLDPRNTSLTMQVPLFCVLKEPSSFPFQHVNAICIIHAKCHYLTSTSPTGMEPS